jgi:hypothetical protein
MTRIELTLLVALLCASASISIAILYWLVNVAVMVWGVL